MLWLHIWVVRGEEKKKIIIMAGLSICMRQHLPRDAENQDNLDGTN